MNQMLNWNSFKLFCCAICKRSFAEDGLLLTQVSDLPLATDRSVVKPLQAFNETMRLQIQKLADQIHLINKNLKSFFLRMQVKLIV